MNCYILTGGESKRMGRPKAQLDLGGRTFVERIADEAAAVFEQVLEVTPSTATLPDVVRDAPHSARAAIFGVLAALEHAAGRDAWIVSADLPLVTRAFFRHAAARHSSSSAALTVPVWDGRWQMLCAGYGAAMLPLVAARVAAGALALHPLAQLVTREVLGEEELRQKFGDDLLWNVNTPADYDELRRRHE